ncbi:MAG TPA: hypothetical protein VN753_14270 [Terracidiphilus sp.]|nr:hypothetical protein [Terracidiphilus sp.]
MIERSKPHLVSIRLSVLLVMLGTCVFLWGFGYKLSLYDTHQQTLHRIPEAKLLCKSEDAQAADGARQSLSIEQAGTSSRLLQACLFATAAAMARAAHLKVESGELRRSKPLSVVLLSGLYFRPPPPIFSI